MVGNEVRLCHGAAFLEAAVKLLPGSFKVRTVFGTLNSFLVSVQKMITVFFSKLAV